MTWLPPAVAPIVLLLISNVFMTFAWYGHLKYTSSPLYMAVIASWGIALKWHGESLGKGNNQARSMYCRLHRLQAGIGSALKLFEYYPRHDRIAHFHHVMGFNKSLTTPRLQGGWGAVLRQ